MLAGLVVLTRVPVRVAAESTAAATRPAGLALVDAAKRVGANLFSLGGGTGRRRTAVRLFDQDADDLIDLDDARGRRHLRRPPGPRKPKVQLPEPDEPVETEQLEIELGPAVKGSPWKLPPPNLLHRMSSPGGRPGRRRGGRATSSSRRSRSTASRRSSSAWWSARRSPATSSSSARA